MIDLWIMRKLLLNINNCTIGFIGDADQLPSVKCGSVLRDLIKCNIIPCVQLDHIHRQSADALNICNNAANIKKGIEKLETGEDFEIIEASNLESAEEKIIKTALKTIEKYGESEVKVLCPFKKGYCGVYRINNILQEKLNPLTGTKEISVGNGMKIHLGDPVMQLKNRKEVSNGDTGFVLYVNNIVHNNRHLHVQRSSRTINTCIRIYCT